MAKRILECCAVALPAIVMLAAMAFLSGSLVFGAGSWILVGGVLVLAALVLTQHWAAYFLVMAAGIAFLLQIGLLVLGAWIFAGIYLVVSVPNLIQELRARRMPQPGS